VRPQRSGRSTTESRSIEQALINAESSCIADPEEVVDTLFTETFISKHTDFPDLDAFLDHAGVDSIWAFSRWLDWVLDWHVLGNTRFWSWEWMVHAAVALQGDADRVGPVACKLCAELMEPVTGSSIEEPGRADTAWVDYRCSCGAVGQAEIREPDGGVRLSGQLNWPEQRFPVVRGESETTDSDSGAQ
jgi:hypothetical protein